MVSTRRRVTASFRACPTYGDLLCGADEVRVEIAKELGGVWPGRLGLGLDVADEVIEVSHRGRILPDVPDRAWLGEPVVLAGSFLPASELAVPLASRGGRVEQWAEEDRTGL